ncbi:DnaD domain-containing protein [Radiobacillus sp. PE A8.2]|uniref:DnaD domain-containing protein n=1 Tax=Radiobacillus sp. PE A8.2 TaxID=3380349 RepID=UPI0038907A10
MNYIKEINAFYNHIETNPLSSSAITLWYTLMHISNKTGWKKQFTVAATVLKMKSGLKDSAFKRARKQLQEKGYISFQSQGGNQAAKYQMVSLLSMIEHPTEQFTTQTKEQSAEATAKQDNIKEEDNTIPTEAVTFYEQNFGKLQPYMRNELEKSITDVGEALVLEAMKRALDYNKISWGYVKKVLNNWTLQGITSVEQIRMEEDTFRKKKRHANKRHNRTEIIPDFFKERQEPVEKQKTPALTKMLPDIAAIMNKYQERGEIVAGQ